MAFHFWKAIWQFLSKCYQILSNTSFDTAIPLLGISSTETNTYVHRDGCTRKFVEVLSKTVKNWKQSKCPSVGEGYINYGKSMPWNNVQLLTTE